jgi:hypothetical protein
LDYALLWCLLQIGSLFWDDRSFYGANLDTDATINTGGKVNPVPIGSLDVFTRAIMNASYWTSIYAVSDAFTDISNNCVWHILDSLCLKSAVSSLAIRKIYYSAVAYIFCLCLVARMLVLELAIT